MQYGGQRTGGFTGACVGLYATGNGRASRGGAFFRHFLYEGLDASHSCEA
ncbi:hypothetical protein [Cohnella boryungensis]|uniref:Beta-xylosidase C-terminal Concanavalin A-like domain-containing protein n=1 Tax=Cohnella boryungensis TaxID=768479 RepID=A0ABV8SIM4_9BACL